MAEEWLTARSEPIEFAPPTLEEQAAELSRPPKPVTVLPVGRQVGLSSDEPVWLAAVEVWDLQLVLTCVVPLSPQERAFQRDGWPDPADGPSWPPPDGPAWRASDDLGTHYTCYTESGSADDDWWRWTGVVRPAPPPDARRLVLEVLTGEQVTGRVELELG